MGAELTFSGLIRLIHFADCRASVSPILTKQLALARWTAERINEDGQALFFALNGETCHQFRLNLSNFADLETDFSKFTLLPSFNAV